MHDIYFRFISMVVMHSVAIFSVLLLTFHSCNGQGRLESSLKNMEKNLGAGVLRRLLVNASRTGNSSKPSIDLFKTVSADVNATVSFSKSLDKQRQDSDEMYGNQSMNFSRSFMNSNQRIDPHLFYNMSVTAIGADRLLILMKSVLGKDVPSASSDLQLLDIIWRNRGLTVQLQAAVSAEMEGFQVAPNQHGGAVNIHSDAALKVLYDAYSTFLGATFINLLQSILGEEKNNVTDTALEMFKIVINTPVLMDKLTAAVEVERARKLKALGVTEDPNTVDFVCTFDNDFTNNSILAPCEFVQCISDDGDWTVMNGPAPNSATGEGPVSGYAGSSGYLLLESNKIPLFGVVRIHAPWRVKLGYSFCLKFWFNMFGSGFSKLVVEELTASNDKNIVWQLTQKDNQKNGGWQETVVVLDPFAVSYAIAGYNEPPADGDIAIDQIIVLTNTSDCFTNAGGPLNMEAGSNTNANANNMCSTMCSDKYIWVLLIMYWISLYKEFV